ncbi:MAG: hypothetical protein LBE38_09690 [Deltaproteobacteria bacterium]|jgi:hypothetical protein|nr:hypothetical protein [Deltaproteobacteria bacterium]
MRIVSSHICGLFINELSKRAGLILILSLFVISSEPLFAQGRLSGPEKLSLLAIAREPLSSAFESRAPRIPDVGPRLRENRPVVVSLYLDGQLVARSWVLERPGPLVDELINLSTTILSEPMWGRVLTAEEHERVQFGVGVLSRFTEIPDEKAWQEGQAVVVMRGFKTGLALPGDLPVGTSAFDLFSFASEMGGMRKGTWLLDDSSLFTSPADEVRE